MRRQGISFAASRTISVLLDSQAVRHGRAVQARSFAGLMDLYELNYIRFRNIAPDLDIADELLSSVPGHQDLYLSVLERCKYTTRLRMTYRFDDGSGGYLFEPDLVLKVYHDARVIEVEQLTRRRTTSFNKLVDKKWRMNRFLFKWLGYCLHQGHYFQPISHLKTARPDR